MRCRFCMGMFHEKSAWEEICSLECARQWFFRMRRGDEKRFLDWADQHRRMICDGPMAEYPKCGGMSQIVVRQWTTRDRAIAARYRDVGFGCDFGGIHTTMPSQTGFVMFGWFNEDQLQQSREPSVSYDGIRNNEYYE